MLRKLHKALTTKSNADIVTIANALFPNEGFSMKDDFLTANRENFMCESQTIDYSDPEKAAESINEWVKNSTNGTADPCITCIHYNTISFEMSYLSLNKLLALRDTFF